MTDKLSEIIEGEKKLAELRLYPDRARHPEYARRFSASGGEVRGGLCKIFDPESNYHFVRTVANPLAVAEIPKYQEDLRKARGITHDDCWFYFDERLLEVYHEALDRLVKKSGLMHVRYAMVEKGSEYWDGKHGDEPSWPQIHVIRGEEPEKIAFRRALGALNGDEAYEFIKKKQEPQNYELGEVNLLRRLEILPLVLQDRTWSVKGDQLRDALDFLAPLGIHYDSPTSHDYGDD